MNIKKIATAAVVLALASGTASAGNWETWVESVKGKEMTIVASFAGDGETQETQMDLATVGDFKVISAKALVTGAVCVASPEHNMIRAVPPSGAGVALPKAMTDTCAFSIKVKGDTEKFASNLNFKFLECVSPAHASLGCNADLRDLKSTKLIQSKNIAQ